jgi:hypothetical protein
VGKRLATWFGTPLGQAFKWTLIIESTSILAAVLQKVIEGLQEHPKNFPLPQPVLVEILSVHWQLIFIGFGTLIGSFLATARTRRAPDVLLGPYIAVLLAVLVVELIYGVWPWIGLLWLRVVLTDAIGLSVIYYCVDRAARVRTT